MTDADKFLAAIIADPDDDLPRLVFADWLEEHGDSDRAEFIRVQCAATRKGSSSVEWPDLIKRANALLFANIDKWKIAGIKGPQRFDRGFVESLHMSAEEFVKHANRIGATAPVVDLRLSAAASHTTPLIDVPWLGRLRTLEIQNDNMGSRLHEWFRPGAFPELRSLELRNNRLWSDHAATLAELSANLPKLEYLDLSGNPLGDEGLAHLASAPTLGGLRNLVLRSHDIDEEYAIHAPGVEALAASTTLPRLRMLILSGHRIGDEGFGSFISSPCAGELDLLDVSHNGIGYNRSDWATALSESKHVGNLRELDFGRNAVAPAAVPQMIQWLDSHTKCILNLRGCSMATHTRELVQQQKYGRIIGLDEVPA